MIDINILIFVSIGFYCLKADGLSHSAKWKMINYAKTGSINRSSSWYNSTRKKYIVNYHSCVQDTRTS